MLKNMLVGAAVFAAVGAVIALTLPLLAPVLTSTGIISPALGTSIASGAWYPLGAEALSFGLFGALVPPIQALANHFCGVDAAKENILIQQKVETLEAREQMLEQSLVPSRSVQKILAQGPRNTVNFVQAEQNRIELPESPTIH